MVDRALGEAAAHREPGVPGADDDGRVVRTATRSAVAAGGRQLTSTVTSVGLVTMS